MVYKIVWTFQARKDLKSIKEYIQQDSFHYAEKLVAHLYEMRGQMFCRNIRK